VLSIRISRELSDFTLSIDVECAYPVTAIFGASGSGKTTLLNLVAGLLGPDEGEIELDGEVLFSSKRRIDLPPEQRKVGLVFQDDLLFPHLTVKKNLRYGYDLLPSSGRKFELDQVVDLLELAGLMDRLPEGLSGGERQRVALGRAILASPRLLLLDEPLSSLDQVLKDRIIPYLRHIRTELQIPMLYVSHSVAEILELTGQVIVLQRGKVLAHGDFFDIAHKPEVLPLVEAHGFENVLPVEVIATESDEGSCRVKFGDHEILVPPCNRSVGQRLFIGIRANDIILSRTRPEGLSIRNVVEGRILEISNVDGKQLVYVDVGKRVAVEVTMEAVRELDLKRGDQILCLVKAQSIRIGPDVE
jgi:molybdate transport system ATP-binding protein